MGGGGKAVFFKASIQLKPLNETEFISNRPLQFNESTCLFPYIQSGNEHKGRYIFDSYVYHFQDYLWWIYCLVSQSCLLVAVMNSEWGGNSAASCVKMKNSVFRDLYNFCNLQKLVKWMQNLWFCLPKPVEKLIVVISRFHNCSPRTNRLYFIFSLQNWN